MQASLEIARAETVPPASKMFGYFHAFIKHRVNQPAKRVDISLLVEVVAVLAYVVQLGVDGGFILAMAVLRHSSVTLARKMWLKFKSEDSVLFCL